MMRILLLSLVLVSTAAAQTPDTLELALPEIEIEATRRTETSASAPFAVSLMARGPAEVALQPALGLESVLRELPGLWINDRAHFALGDRLSIRGMGWRAAFGVRGVQVLLDGIPLTLPDGQAVVDMVDPSFVRRAELIRGPSSLFWGNGSGGTLFLSTDAFDGRRLRARAVGGSHGTRQLSTEVKAPVGRHRFQAFVSDLRQDGYRAYSGGRFTRASLHGDLDLGMQSRLRLTFAATDQDTENPGSLTKAQFLADPRQANALSVQTGADKQSTQLQTGASLLHRTPLGVVTATVYGIGRRLDNALTYAYVEFDRRAGGTRIALQDERGAFSWGIGVDAGLQHDERLNWNNDGGSRGTSRLLDQVETVRAVAGSGFLRAAITRRASLTAGLRADRIRFGMDDRLLDNGDQSGNRTFAAWSPAAGFSYALPSALLFVNYSTAFETPTSTELVNRPDMTGGFNPSLEPQRVRGLEAGVRGRWLGGRVFVDAAIFDLHVRDRLTPYQTPEGGDRTFFRNAGENEHRGVEVSTSLHPRRDLRLQLSYSGSRFVFLDEPLRGNRLPGIPEHRIYAAISASRSGFWGRIAGEFVNGYFVNDANTEETEAYSVFDINLGHSGIPIGAASLQPFLRIANLFDVAYSGSVIINAFGGRYYEPAPGRTVQAGVGLAL